MNNNPTEKEFTCPTVIMGDMGSGKSTVLVQHALNVAKSGQSAVLFVDNDYLLDLIAKANSSVQSVPCDIWDFSSSEVLEHFALTLNVEQAAETSISILDTASTIDRLYQLYLAILQDSNEYSLNDGSKALLAAACKVVFTKPNQTFYQLYQFLNDDDIRKAYLENVSLDNSPLLNAHELDLLNGLSAGHRTSVMSNLSILARFNPVFRDFRVKTLLSNMPSSTYHLSQVFEPGKLTVFYFPRLKYTAEVRDLLTSLLTFNLQLIQETKRTSSRPMHLMYDEIFQTPKTLKLLTRSLNHFSRSNFYVTITLFDYNYASKFLDALLPYQPEFIFLTKPKSYTLYSLNLEHMKPAVKALNWDRFQSLRLNAGTTAVVLNQIPALN